MRKSMRKAISTFLIAGLLVTGFEGFSVCNNPYKVNAAVVAGTPYNTEGNYDVNVEHVVINQVYGGGNNKGAGSHGFIELYNPTDQTIDLSTWSVQYEGSPGDTKNAAGWHKLDLTGNIPAHSSYLIRTKKYKDDTTPANFNVPKGDMQWDEISINGKGVAVALMSNQQLLKDNDLFDNKTKKPLKDGYVDLVGVHGNDSMDSEKAPVYEGYATDSQSTKKAVRRIAFQDTDCNAVGEDDGDFVIIEYNAKDADYLEWAKPRNTSDGAWQASPMPEFKETTSLSNTSINVLTNTFGNNVESTRQFTWQMPTIFTEGYVNISVNENMSDYQSFKADVVSNNKKAANVFKVNATGLNAKTKYYYQAVSGDIKSPVYTFTTGSLSDDFTFVRASDSQSKTESGYDTFQKAVSKIQSAYNPAFIIETGDLVDTNYFEDEWRWFIGKSQSMFASTAYIPVVGNHEETSAYPAWAFREHFSVPNECKDEGVTPGTVYSFDYGKVHFLVLNSECKGEGLKAQAKWAAEDLAKTKQKYIIAAIHRGPYGGAGIASDIRDAFVPVFDEYNVDLVLFGHDHSYIRTKSLKNGAEDKDGTVYLECGGCASKQDLANSTIPGYAEITGTPGMPVYDVINVSDECISVKTVTVDETKDSIEKLEDTGNINYAVEGAKIDFKLYPKKRQQVENETTSPQPTSTASNVKEEVTTTKDNKSLKTTPGRTKITKVKKVKKISLKIAWKKALNAKKYQVQISLSSKFKKAKKYKTVSYTTSKKTIKIGRLIKGKKYYLRVRGVSGRNYGKWSKIKVKNI